MECFLCLENGKKCSECGFRVCKNCSKKTGCGSEGSRCFGQFCIEAPPFVYRITYQDLPKIIRSYGLIDDSNVLAKAKKKTAPCWGNQVSGDLILELMPKNWTKEQKAEVFTSLRDLEDPRIEQSSKAKHIKTKKTDMTKNPFTDLEVLGLFFNPSSKTYSYIPLVIEESSIKLAGMGVYAKGTIPKGSYGFYRGTIKTEKAQNCPYSWTINDWDQDGESLDEIVYYKDATYFEHSNWSRFVNCPNHGVKCNMVMNQLYHTVFYEAIEDIKLGSELFIDYGEEYREDNLELETKDYEAQARCISAPNKKSHLLTRSTDFRFEGGETLPGCSIFKCKKEGCKYYKREFFWCDICEKAKLQEKFSQICLDCCQMCCGGCEEEWGDHDH